MEKVYEASGKLAVISCTHGNIPALEAVLEDIAARGIKRLIHLGDSVGYGPEPEALVSLLQERKISSIQGCWDKTVAEGQDDCGCEFLDEEEARRGEELFAWTFKRVSMETRKYLGSLPARIRLKAPCGSVLFVHGSPRSPNEYLSEDKDPLVLLERAHSAECDYLVCGHTHVPFMQKVSGTVSVEKAHPSIEDTGISEMTVKSKYVYNVGSVGEPLNGTDATYLIMDLNTGEAEIVHVPFDIEETLRRMKKACVPSFVIERFQDNDEITRKDRVRSC